MPSMKTGSWPKMRWGLGVILIALVFANGCTPAPVVGGPVDSARLQDGIYEGSYRGGPNKAVVKVTIKNQAIAHIEIVEDQAWKGKKAEKPIVQSIIAHQSTRVDAVSGATNSSHVIMNAVQDAIEKAYRDR